MGEAADPTAYLRDFALTTLHTTLFVLLPLLLTFAVGDPGGLGDLLGGLETSIGLALFAYLWLVLWVTTRRALTAADPLTRRSALRAGFVWGAASGVGFVGGVLLVAGGFVTVTTGNLAFFPVVFGLGSLVASVVGAVLGLLFAAADLMLLALTRRVAGG
jgi:hypothetical protein